MRRSTAQCPSDESDDSIEDRNVSTYRATAITQAQNSLYATDESQFGYHAGYTHTIDRAWSSSPPPRMNDDHSNDSSSPSDDIGPLALHQAQSYDELACEVKQRFAPDDISSWVVGNHSSVVNHHQSSCSTSTRVSSCVTTRNRMSSLASRRYHRSQSTSDVRSPRNFNLHSLDEGKTRDRAALQKLRNAFSMSRVMAMQHLPSRHEYAVCVFGDAQDEGKRGDFRERRKKWGKNEWVVACSMLILSAIALFHSHGFALFGPRHSIKGGLLGRAVDSALKKISIKHSNRKIAKRVKNIEDMTMQIRTLLEIDAKKAMRPSQVRKESRDGFDIPRHILWAPRHKELQNHETLLEKWGSFILSHDNVESKFEDRYLPLQEKNAESSAEFQRVFAFGNKEMRSSMSQHDICAALHQAFVALPDWDDRVSLWSICDLYWYGGAFISEQVSDLAVPLHEIVRISKEERTNIDGPVGCAVMRSNSTKNGEQITSASADLALIAVSPRHPALLAVIENLSDEDSVQKLLKRSSNPSRIIADLLYDVIASHVGLDNLVKHVQNGGGTIHANSASLGSWKLLIEECAACESGSYCEVYDRRRKDGATKKKGVDSKKDFGIVVMKVQHGVDRYVDERQDARTFDRSIGVEVIIRESEGTPALEPVIKKSLQEVMVKNGCEPSWLCNRCLRYSGLGSLSSCSMVCSECYEDIICSSPTPSKDVQMEVIINVAKKDKNKDSSSRLIPRIIHQTWFEELTQERYPQLVRLQNSWIAAGWEYRFYDDVAARKFIVDNFPNRFVYAYDSLIPGAYKADFFRYLVLLKSGGVYADIDVMLNTHLDSLIPPDLSFFVPLDEPGFEGDERFCLWNGLMGTSPGHPFMVRTVERSLNMILNRADAFDIEQEMCQISGREMDYWKIRLSPPLNLCGPCSLGISVNEALERDSMSRYEVGLMKADHNGYRWGINSDSPGHLNFNILKVRRPAFSGFKIFESTVGAQLFLPFSTQQNKKDLGSHRFTDVERDVIVGSTDIFGVTAKAINTGKKDTKKRQHYSKAIKENSVWGAHKVYVDNKMANETITFVLSISET